MAAEKNYSVINIGKLANVADKDFHGMKGKFFIGQELGLTGCEVSINLLPANKFFPFVHAHKMNEEVYIVLSGKGMFFVDGEEFPVQEGSLIRVAPDGARSIKAEEDLLYLCIQAQNNSLSQVTKDDGLIIKTKPSWAK